MTTPIISLSNAVRDAVSNATGKTFTRRYAPYYEAADVQSGVWYVVATTETVQKKRRVDIAHAEISLAYQIALPDSTSENPKPLENNTFLDSCMAEVESVKSLFRENGDLADASIGNWAFLKMTNDPIYVPNMLEDHLIFTSVIRLEFLAEGE